MKSFLGTPFLWLSLLDVLISLAMCSHSLEASCFLDILTDSSKAVVDIEEGKHPCLDTLGISYIPNDIDGD